MWITADQRRLLPAVLIGIGELLAPELLLELVLVLGVIGQTAELRPSDAGVNHRDRSGESFPSRRIEGVELRMSATDGAVSGLSSVAFVLLWRHLVLGVRGRRQDDVYLLLLLHVLLLRKILIV